MDADAATEGMAAVREAISRTGPAPSEMDPIERLCWKFEKSRADLVECLHDGRPTLTGMRSAGVGVRFPADRAETVEPLPLSSVLQSAEVWPGGLAVMTSIGISDSESARIWSGTGGDLLDRRLGDGVETHAAKLESTVAGLAAGYRRRTGGGPKTRLGYGDLVADNPDGLFIVRSDVRDPSYMRTFMQIETVYLLPDTYRVSAAGRMTATTSQK